MGPAHAAQPSYLALTNFGEVSTRASIRCCVRTGILWGFPGSSDWSGGRGATALPLCSEVLASALVIPLRPAGTSPILGEEFKGYFLLGFSPVVGARCRPPISKITPLHPFMGKTVRIIRNPIAHCKQGGNKNEIENMVRTNSCARKVRILGFADHSTKIPAAPSSDPHT